AKRTLGWPLAFCVRFNFARAAHIERCGADVADVSGFTCRLYFYFLVSRFRGSIFTPRTQLPANLPRAQHSE
ncbi:hypothetical protein BKA70DRAFT_1359613, partial [Coprinopsis sp. MPI-PUGE-AT-0042]